MTYTTKQIDDAITAECLAWAAFFKIEPTAEKLAGRAAFHRANLALNHIGQLAEFLPQPGTHHYTDKTHFFRDDNDDRLAVVTTLQPDGYYAAFVLDNPNCDDHRQGYGKTRMEAIVELREILEGDQ